jgi:hypothetical protein
MLATVAATLILALAACGDRGNYTAPTSFENGKLTVSFDYTKQSGYATNQFAVWVEDMDGNYVNTLYATGFTANGGYENRPEAIPTWVQKSQLAAMDEGTVDSISGATPKAGSLSYAWDLTDTSGNTVAPGDYQFFVEGSLRWKNRVLYSGVITVGDAPAEVEASVESIYEASDDQAALSQDSAENAMLGAVTASFEPAAA